MKAVNDFFLNEWYFSIPLVIMSLIAAALVIWRMLLNMSANTDMDEFLPVFQQTLRKNGIKGAVDTVQGGKGADPEPAVRRGAGGRRPGRRGDAAQHGQRERNWTSMPRLHFLLAPILAIAKIATMVGLFFTVISMINTFNAIGEQSASGKAKEIGGHASKIGLALFATAHGPVHRDPARVQPRAVQGLDFALRGQDQGRVAEADHARDQLQEGPEAARSRSSISTRTRRNRRRP